MASTFVKSNRMKRTESKKSHSWWWDSHICPKNSKWLQENLEEMDQHVKRMLKLIEEDADSFAKRAEMYYQKRPELVSLVEEFYRMYRSLAERYDHVTGELRKSIPSDLQSRGSSGVSDVGPEPPSTLPSPDRWPSRKYGPRAAGFDFFLVSGGGNGPDLYNNNNSNTKEGDESSTLESESESDDSSSVHNYPGTMQSNDDEQGLRLKIIQLEVELCEVKEKLRAQEKETSEKCSNEISEDAGRIAVEYEEELQDAREKIRLSEEEISRLTIELQKFESLGNTDNLLSQVLESSAASRQQNHVTELEKGINGSEAQVLDSLHKIQALEKELRITLEKLHNSEYEVASLRQELASKGFTLQDLQDQLKSAQKDKLEREEREVPKLQDRVAMHKTNLSNSDHEIRELKEAMSNANKSLSEENERVQLEKTRITKERTHFEDNLKEMDLRRQSLKEEVRRVKVAKAEMEDIFGAQIEQLKAQVAEKNECVEDLKKNLVALQLKYEMLMAEKDYPSIDIAALAAEVSSKDDQIDEMSKHLHQLHMEHVDLIAGAEGARKLADKLCSRIKELEREVERKQEVILQGAEEKREAIRQLCFSLEHYRNGYHRLRQAVMGHKGLPVMAS